VHARRLAQEGGSLMTEFAGEGWDDLIKELAKRGLDIDIKGKDGWTPLMVAASGGHVKVLPPRRRLAAGAAVRAPAPAR
jgi:ankyrin repeat protein